MSRFCNKHLSERTDSEIVSHLEQADKNAQGKDPRSREGKRFLKQRVACVEELKKRGVVR